MCECVAGGRAYGGEQVEGLVGQGAVGELQARQLRHVADDEPQGGLADLQPTQTQDLQVTQLRAVLRAWGWTEGEGERGREMVESTQEGEEETVQNIKGPREMGRN